MDLLRTERTIEAEHPGIDAAGGGSLEQDQLSVREVPAHCHRARRGDPQRLLGQEVTAQVQGAQQQPAVRSAAQRYQSAVWAWGWRGGQDRSIAEGMRVAPPGGQQL